MFLSNGIEPAAVVLMIGVMSEDQASLNYIGDAGRHYHGTKRSIPDLALPWVSRLRAKKLSPFIRANHTVFEFGVGYGWNLAALECGRKLGHDISSFLKPSLEKQGIEFIAEKSSLADASIDVAICHHTLEHVLNPPSVLQELHRVLRPKGTLLLFTPYEKEKRYRHYDPGEPNHHLYSWNVQTLGNLVASLGFKLSEAKLGRFGYDRFAAQWAVRLNVGEVGFRFIRSAIHVLKPAFEVRVVATKIR